MWKCGWVTTPWMATALEELPTPRAPEHASIAEQGLGDGNLMDHYSCLPVVSTRTAASRQLPNPSSPQHASLVEQGLGDGNKDAAGGLASGDAQGGLAPGGVLPYRPGRGGAGVDGVRHQQLRVGVDLRGRWWGKGEGGVGAARVVCQGECVRRRCKGPSSLLGAKTCK